MKNKKILKIISIVIIIILFSICIINNHHKNKLEIGEKIIDNFENIDEWQVYDYELDYKGNNKSVVTISGEGYKDNSSLYISSDILNDVRIYRNIKIEPNSYYKLSVMIKGEAGIAGKGISISAINCKESYDIRNTSGEWQEYTIYVKTDKEQDELKFSLGLGGYSNVSKGYVYFDDFSLEKIEKLPVGRDSITFTSNTNSNAKSTENEVVSKLIFLGIVTFILIISIVIMKKKTNLTYEKYKLDKYDYIIMISLTLICGVMSFYKLGNNYAPSSFWKPGKAGEYIIIEFDDVTNVHAIAHYGNIPSDGYYKISYSIDNENYDNFITLGKVESKKETETEKSKSYFFRWELDKGMNLKCKYIKIEAIEPGWGINELAFLRYSLDKFDYEIMNFKIKEVNQTKESLGTPEMLFDEQEIVELIKTYMNGTYFDEIYFPRTAYEQLNGWKIYETTHPPFGKILISIGIAIFGMNPFGWRFMGTLFGVLLIPLMYLFAIKIFKNRKYAFIATFLLLFDFMRFSHTRLATIDSFSTFFVLAMYYFMFDFVMNEKYRIISNKKNEFKFFAETKEEKKQFNKSLKSLFLCGIMFGLGAATKWSCVYAGAGLAFVFFMTKFFEYWEIRKLKRVAKKWFIHNFMKTCLWCILFFIIIPSIIYISSYTVYMPSKPHKSLIEIVVDNQIHMFNYHSNLTSTHTFQSRWWSWPLNMRPIWIFANYDLPNNTASTISSFGNPAVWWMATIGVLVSIVLMIKNKDKKAWVLFVAYIFQYIPWILTTRCTFIYAYFIPLPFSILLLVYCIEKININEKLKNALIVIYLIVVYLLFVKFFPIISGTIASEKYIESLEWFKTWNF